MPTKTEPKEAPHPAAPRKTDWDDEAAKVKEDKPRKDPPLPDEGNPRPGVTDRPAHPPFEAPPNPDAPYQDPTAIPWTERSVPVEGPPPDPVGDMEARLEALLERRLEMMQRRIELLALKAVEGALPQAVQMATQAAAAASNNKPPLTLRANVADNFISSGGRTSPHLGHYRCERLKACKVQEFDMSRWRAYEEGELEWPKDKHGRKIRLQSLCVMQGSYIPFLDGHAYPTTENQKACLLLYKNELSEAEGGMPDLYEDTSVEPFRCKVCQGSTDTWTSREGFAAHMLHVHGVMEQAA